MNVEHIPAKDVDMLPCGADWQSRHLESEKRKAEIRDRIHKQAEQGQKTAKDYFRPAKPTPSIYDSDLKRVAVYARVSTSSEEQISSIENQTLYYTKKIAETENWNLQDIYSDEGKSGTSVARQFFCETRTEFLRKNSPVLRSKSETRSLASTAP